MWPFSVSVPERPGPVGHNRPITRKTSSLFVRTEKINKLYYTKLVCLGCPNAVKRKSTSLSPMRSIIARAGWNLALVNYSVSSLLGGSSSRYLSSSDHSINPSTLEYSNLPFESRTSDGEHPSTRLTYRVKTGNDVKFISLARSVNETLWVNNSFRMTRAA